jgi:hypothetical protein
MVPFRVFDRENKQWWVVLNYHPGTSAGDQGSYLLAREDDDEAERDGTMAIVGAADLAKFRLVDFLEESEGYGE